MALQTPRRRALTTLGIVVAFALLSAGAWALRRWQPFASEPAEVTWPANIQPIADAVEQLTGMRFTASLRVEYIANRDKFLDATRTTVTSTDESKQNAATDAAVGRALGLWRGDVDILADETTLRESGVWGASWQEAEDTLVVNAQGDTATLTPFIRAEVAFTLAQVLNEQVFGVRDLLARTATPQEYQALIGLDYGQATWVREEYVADMPSKDRDVYDSSTATISGDYQSATSFVTPGVRLLRSSRVAMGAAFVRSLHESADHDAFTKAFTTDLPTAIDQESLPVSKYAERRDVTEPVSPTPVPNGGSLEYHRQMGPFVLFGMMATSSLPLTEALTAADGWGNDDFVVYRLDGTVCVDARIVADSRDDADRLERGLSAWGHSRPKASKALVGRDGNDLLLSVCDPGPDVAQGTLSTDDAQQFFGRSQIIDANLRILGLPSVAECVTKELFATHPADDIRPVLRFGNESPEIQDLLDSCRTH